MNRSFSAPGTPEDLHARSVLVLAPHYDDEVLGCGGLLVDLVRKGAVARVLFLTDGRGQGEDDPDAYARERREEARAAAKVLGLKGVDVLDLPDGRLDEHLDAAVAGIRRALLTLRPELLLVTSPLEASADHRAAFAAVHRLLGGVRGRGELAELCRGLTVLAYEVNHPFVPDVLVDVSAAVGEIERAMACYASQQARHDYLGARLGLLRFRAHTLPPGIAAAEAYRRFAAEDFTTRGAGRMIAEMGGSPERLEIVEGPEISVVVRTMNRPRLLREALESLWASTYRRAEVIVVNDGGEPPELPAEAPLPCRLVDLDDNRGRAAAANAGLAAARGDAVAFLDDDDRVEPEHLATLAGLISAAGVRVAYTDAAVAVYELAGEEGWRERERRLPYSRDFDPDLLLVDNYIPFNTVVLDRRLVDEVGPLDESLPFFEDWDFLIRLAERTPFHHLARVTCEYRQFRGAGHHVLGDRPRERADFLAMKERVLAKHARRLGPEVLVRMVDRLRAAEVASGEEVRRLDRELAASAGERHRLNGRLAALETHLAAVEETGSRLREELADERRVRRETDRELQRLFEREKRLEADLGEAQARHGGAVEELRLMTEQEARVADELRATYREIERLNALVRDMESTKAWRLHQWWQGKRR